MKNELMVGVLSQVRIQLKGLTQLVNVIFLKKRGVMSDKEYARTTAKKRADTAKGKQWSKQPK